jgi:hypothetical protein
VRLQGLNVPEDMAIAGFEDSPFLRDKSKKSLMYFIKNVSDGQIVKHHFFLTKL